MFGRRSAIQHQPRAASTGQRPGPKTGRCLSFCGQRNIAATRIAGRLFARQRTAAPSRSGRPRRLRHLRLAESRTRSSPHVPNAIAIYRACIGGRRQRHRVGGDQQPTVLDAACHPRRRATETDATRKSREQQQLVQVRDPSCGAAAGAGHRPEGAAENIAGFRRCQRSIPVRNPLMQRIAGVFRLAQKQRVVDRERTVDELQQQACDKDGRAASLASPARPGQIHNLITKQPEHGGEDCQRKGNQAHRRVFPPVAPGPVPAAAVFFASTISHPAFSNKARAVLRVYKCRWVRSRMPRSV